MSGRDNASENILAAISKLDSSMAKMVEQDPQHLKALYGAIRLQIENLEAKCSNLLKYTESGEPGDQVTEKFDQKIENAESEFDNSKNTPSNLRKYMAARLEAIYYLLAARNIYQSIPEARSDDFEVIDPSEIEVGE